MKLAQIVLLWGACTVATGLYAQEENQTPAPGGQVVPGKNFIAAQQKAGLAADAYASVIAKRGTADYAVELKATLNKAYPTAVLKSQAAIADLSSWAKVQQSFSDKTPPDKIKKEILDIVGGIPTGSPLPPTLNTSLLDNDPRYLNNLVALTGAADGRIYGGLPTTAYLNTVAVSGATALCTGTVVSKNAVITAQHCYCDGATKQIFIGADMLQPGMTYKVSRAIPMRSCDAPISREADVALLFVDTPFPSSVVPAKFASTADIDSSKTLRAVGFGRTETGMAGRKMMVDLPVASNACAGLVSTAEGTKSDPQYYKCNANFEMVVGAATLNKDTCNGDSGGPLFRVDATANDDSSALLVAITSRAVGVPNARDCGDGGIYVRADGDIAKWVTSTLSSESKRQ